MNSRNQHRCGTVLVCVLACCLTAISLGAAAIQLSLRAARESKQTLRLRQTQWLLQAGVQRARRQLANSDYTGEVWSLPLAASLGTEPRIVIAVAPVKPAENKAENSALKPAEISAGKPTETANDPSESAAAEREEPTQQQVQWRVSVTAEYGGSAEGQLPIRRSHAFTIRRPSGEAD